MHPQEFREMQALEADHWWFVGKRLLLGALLDRPADEGSGAERPTRILDIGCGSGETLQALSRGALVMGIDSEGLPLRYCRERGLERLVRASAIEMPFRDGSFDACVMMDVLEHVDEEHDLLLEVRRVLRAGGAAVVSVPAFQMLWSQHDVSLEHRRRYRRKELEERVAEAGLRVEWSGYTNFFAFPPALLWRTIRRWTSLAPEHRTDFFTLPKLINQAIVDLYRLESALVRRIRLPFGVSVACVARRG